MLLTKNSANMKENDSQSEVIMKCKGGGSIVDKIPIFSPNGLSVIIPCKNVLKSFSVVNGERITDYEGVDDTIIGAGFHPNNSKLLIACTETGEVICWKWKMELVMYKKKLNILADKVNTFHLFSLNEYEEDDCDIFLSWTMNSEIKFGAFKLKDCKLREDYPIHIESKEYLLDVGGKAETTFTATIQHNKLILVNLKNPEKFKRTKIGKSRKLTCVTCHPEEEIIATGDTSGRVVIWQNLFSNSAPTQSVHHWHTLPVRCIAFSATGSTFYSGGSECVVVKWTMDNVHQKNFLPRLPAPIKHLGIGPENLTITISMEDNGVRLVDSQFRLKSVIQHLVWGAPFTAGLLIDMNTRSLVLNGRPGHLQFYSPRDMSLLYNLDVVGQNQLSRERLANIQNTAVVMMAVSKGSEWLCTVEQRLDGDIIQELRIKFWQFDTKDRTYILNTNVEFPHEGGVTGVEFQPASKMELVCVTTGKDRCFKVWNLEDTSTIYKKSLNWGCAYIGYYKNFESNSLSFSSDGSVFAVAFDCCLTLWLPDSCTMKASLVHSTYKAPLKKVQFGNVDKSHLIVTVTEEYLCVWNLLTLGLIWTVPVKVKLLCSDPCSSHMAAITTSNNLFVFEPSSSNVVFSKTDLCKNGQILAAAFMPLGTERINSLSWQKNSQLYFVSSKQEILCLASAEEEEIGGRIEYTAHEEKSAFSALIAQNIKSDVKKGGGGITFMEGGLAGTMTFKELLAPPVHTMAPMRMLCGSVLRSIAQSVKNTASTDDRIEESEEEEDILKSDQEDESSDETTRRRRLEKPEADEIKDESTKPNLRSVVAESTAWTSILV